MEENNENSSYEENCAMGCRTTFGSKERTEEEILRRLSPKNQAKYLLKKEYEKELAIKKAGLLLKNTKIDIQYLVGLNENIRQDQLDTLDMSIESIEPVTVDEHDIPVDVL